MPQYILVHTAKLRGITMAAEKVVQIAVANVDKGVWGVLYALTDKGQIFCFIGGSVKAESRWCLIGSPDFDTNVELQEGQQP